MYVIIGVTGLTDSSIWVHIFVTSRNNSLLKKVSKYLKILICVLFI